MPPEDGLELESYLSDSESFSFEHVLSGKYELELTGTNAKLVSVILDVRA